MGVVDLLEILKAIEHNYVFQEFIGKVRVRGIGDRMRSRKLSSRVCSYFSEKDRFGA